MRSQLEVSNQVAAELAGSGDAVLRTLEGHVECDIFLRGNVVTLDGEPEAVEAAATVIRELTDLIEQGHDIAPGTIAAVTGALDQHRSPAEILEDVVWRHRSKQVAPKTVNQKRYVDSIRDNVITFGIGPAGTGKTFLAVALAAAALSRREVDRIILTRPAVEAGERLGFLPGDLMAKIDPYLRPLFDALHDMLDAEKVSTYLERGQIEVAPLAFMRGRAQPVDQPVLTPSGWQAIGTLRVGDLVVGSDGRPTPVLGVYPQGRREVFRLQAQDGASTLCCAEHLWTVRTPDDRKHGKPGRTLRTDEMVGRLRRHHQHRFELPVLSGPVELEPQDVPLDPYALGLLLGDGCMSSRATPSFTTADPELAVALEERLDRIELRRRSAVDYVLRHVDGQRGARRGGVIVANPVTTALRELDLVGTRSSTKFVPDVYLHNAPEVRLGVLQGLLDSDGGPVSQRGRTCRIQYATCSPRLRDDVVFLVRSLGGVAYWRTRPAEGRKPGRVRGRDLFHRSDSHVLDIRLPDGIEPFRLERKRLRYCEEGGGRPMRFVESIEPAGDADTVCIQVAASDSLYVTDDFLVTHNTLNNSFIILDEAQNTTPEQMKMIMTRLGFGSKMVVTGDITQIDLPKNEGSGLVVVGDILQGIEGIEFVRFGGEDVVRHRLVQRIVEAYAEHAESLTSELRPADRRRA
ncbi:MAG: phosphate starvation-inducible protein PhoH [Solirubrobacteraceae bacterium]|nr:phosphate starvation-inducible protein PhoH [Solirubrobacteraceae bacterium]